MKFLTKRAFSPETRRACRAAPAPGRAARARADADRGDVQALGDPLAQPRRYRLEHQHPAPAASSSTAPSISFCSASSPLPATR